METALLVMRGALSYYVLRILGITFLIVVGIILSLKSKGAKTQLVFMTIVLICWLVIYIFTSVVPFVRDYADKDIRIIHGTYLRIDESKGNSAASGIYSIDIISEGKTLSLATAPWNTVDFPVGEFPVIAYYAHNSGILLYIEPVTFE